ncbi:MAG: hypothetical protein HKN44_05755 [Ilumatobacter sp.]|nr:hypothetical protein [Ilumatobacter sp.]
MRFLIVTNSREAMPAEMALPAMHGMQAWLAEHRASGKLEHVWSFAGKTGGGGIANVETHEELDAMMAGFPFGQTSDIDVYALADIDTSLDASIHAISMMMEAVGASA